MDWLILILGVPATLVPLVLLFGFTGCASNYVVCSDDRDCPSGTICNSDGSCVPTVEQPPPGVPADLAAIARDDHSVSLTWTNDDAAVSDFSIERAQEGVDSFAAIARPADLSASGATDAAGLHEGVTFIYRVRALLDGQVSDPSNTSSATVLPASPVNLRARPVSFDEIELTWRNASTVAREFTLEHRVPNDTFREIFRGTATRFTHANDPSLVEGSQHEYRVFAIVVDGFENDAQQDVKSAASAVASATTLSFTPAFTGTLTTDEAPIEGFCVVLRLDHTLLQAGGSTVRMRLRGATSGSLTLDRITISQPATAATSDLYDSAGDITDVAANVTIPANTAVTVGPVSYSLDPSKDLLIAVDISNTPGQGNVRSAALTGAETFAQAATTEAGVADRTTGYPFVSPNNLFLVESIEVV